MTPVELAVLALSGGIVLVTLISMSREVPDDEEDVLVAAVAKERERLAAIQERADRAIREMP